MVKFGPPLPGPMPPPDPVPCSAPGCGYETPVGLPDFAMATQHLNLHIQVAHPVQAPQHVQTAKLDKKLRPVSTLGMTELNWRFFLSEWSRYTRQTGIKDQVLLDELWSTMDTELRQLAFSEGAEETLNTEALMLVRIKSLAVTVLHASVHIVTLHDMKQLPSETVKSFSARVRGTAANCELSKTCTSATCEQKVSFLEDTCYNIVLSGLHDSNMRDRALTQAMLGTVTDLVTLVNYCTAEESGKCTGAQTIGANRGSSYRGGVEHAPSSKCGFCGEKQHGKGSRAEREKLCKAWGKQCSSCGRVNHLSSVCKSASRPLKPKVTEEKTTNAAFGFFSNTVMGRHTPHADASWLYPPTDSLLPCKLGTPIKTANRFEHLQCDPLPAATISPLGLDHHRSQHRHHRARPAYPPCVLKHPQPRELSPPPVPDMEFVPTTVAHLAAWTESDQQSSPGMVRTVSLPHMVHDLAKNWIPANPRASPTCQLDFTLSRRSYSDLHLSLPLNKNKSVRKTQAESVTDTGAQMNIAPTQMVASMGISLDDLFPVKAKIGGPSAEPITILGGVILELAGTNKQTGVRYTSHQLFYVSTVCKHIYLSLDTCIALGIVPVDFPQVGAFLSTDFQTAVNAAAVALPEGASATAPPSLPTCSNTGTILPGDPPCSCPQRSLPPTTKPTLPCEPIEENLPQLKQYIMHRFASSAFNMCERQKLPLMQGSPPLRLHVDPAAKPYAVYTPAQVALHWREAVKGGLDRDERLGVIERVPLNTPTAWQCRMLITPKSNGEPRRLVDYQPVNAHAARQTHHTESCWSLAASVPAGVKKSVLDAWHGYHSLPIAEEDRPLTTFITPFGRYRYCTTPQGFLAAGDGYTDRSDRVMQDVPRMKKCVDDCLLYDSDIATNFYRVCDFLSLCSSNGIIFNSSKFQFAEEEVQFVGFNVTHTGIKPTSEFIDGIMSFPTPQSLTDVRSWFGAVAQISYTFATAPVMLPFRHLLSSKTPFSWSPDLEMAFQESKMEIIRQCEEGVRTFDPALHTALATDWSRVGMGFWLCQKQCDCETILPGCCPSGWQTVYCGSRFCTPAEARYAPIEGEATSAAWGLQKCKFFLLGMPSFLLCLDHKPLISILGPQDLCSIPNPRLLNQKVKTLMYSYQTRYIPGKLHVTPDCFSRRADTPHTLPPATPIPVTDISNVQAAYQSHLGPPSWVSGPSVVGMLEITPPSHPLPDYALLAVLTDQHAYVDDNSAVGMFKAFRQQPSQQELCDAVTTEEMVTGAAIAALSALDTPLYSVASNQLCPIKATQLVTAMTWERVQAAALASTSYKTLHALIMSGVYDDKSVWPTDLLLFYPHRHALIPAGPVLLHHDRPVIPVSLRQELLEHLHGGHQGVTQMYARASASVFWPNLYQDLMQLRATCQICTYIAPSNPAPPPCEPETPSYPFSSVSADFFSTDSGNYLAIVDRYTNWLSIFSLQRDDSAHVIQVLRDYCARWGIPEVLTTDGASVFVSEQMKDFLTRWGIRHRVSSAYYPQANKRAEVGVKSAKRLILDNLGPAGSLNTDRFARALLLHRNCPDPVTGMSPAQIIFGHTLRDHLPGKVDKYQPRPEWREQSERRETALAQRHARTAQKMSVGAKQLPPLACGDHVAIQDQSNPAKSGRWTKTGLVIELLGHDSYLVKVDGSGRTTQRNRRFLRHIFPYPTLIRDAPIPILHPVTTRAQTRAQSIGLPDVPTPRLIDIPTPSLPDIPTPSLPVIPTPSLPVVPGLDNPHCDVIPAQPLHTGQQRTTPSVRGPRHVSSDPVLLPPHHRGPPPQPGVCHDYSTMRDAQELARRQVVASRTAAHLAAINQLNGS